MPCGHSVAEGLGGVLDEDNTLLQSKLPQLQESIQEFYDSVPQLNNSLFIINYLLNLFLYSIFYHPRFYWIPHGIPWLKLGETIFTTEFEVARINHHVIKLGKNLILNFDGIRKKRLELTRIYTEKLKTLRKEFVFFPEFDGEDIALLRFPLIFKNEEKRNFTLAELKRRRLGATGMYPVSLNEQNGVTPYLPGHESYPHAKFISQRILTLPLHEHVRIEDINLICEIIEKSGSA